MTRRLTVQLKSYRSVLTYNVNSIVEQLRSELQIRLPSVMRFGGLVDEFRSGMKIMGCFVGKECSPIFAQRVFRSYRLLQLHSKLWSNHINSLGLNANGSRPLSNKALFSFLIVSLCHSNPNNKIGESILDSELVEHMRDLDFIHDLTSATVVCPRCKDRLVVDKKVPNVKYCHCPDTKSAYDKKVAGYSWTPFVETADLLIWRMPHPERPGLYMYKVYGYYDDISPESFLDAQLDIQYRKKWDDTVLKLEIIESNTDNNQDVIYWEMKWPTMFSNRDYLFARRHLVDKEKQTMVIMSKAVPHSAVPERKGIHRVKEYWSVMQVNSVNGLSEPGVEFGLTYFDNPGLSLPGWLNNWAAMTAIPEFLDKQRNAARARKKAQTQATMAISRSHYSDGGVAVPFKAIKKAQEKHDRNNNNQNRTAEDSNQIKSKTTSLENNTTSTTTGTAQAEPPKTEILSQFFKEHVLHNPQ